MKPNKSLSGLLGILVFLTANSVLADVPVAPKTAAVTAPVKTPVAATPAAPADAVAPTPVAAAAPADDTVKSTDAQTDQDVSRFVDTIELIKKDYAKAINEKTLMENAIRGMVNNLDPHSEYLDEAAYKSLMTTTSGEFGGLGIEIIGEYGVLKVVSPLDNTPASRAGLKSGDYIVSINNQLVSEMTPDKAIEAMRGKKGSEIQMTIIRKGVKDPMKFTLTRDIIHIDNLKSKLLDGNYGYIRINQFQEPTLGLLTAAINDLQKQTNGKLKGLILDLRNNPGGLLDTAVDVVNVFLDSDHLTQFDKKIVYTEGREADSAFKAVATGHDLINGVPLIIMMNEGSASASEIVAGALQDYHRAVIVGTTSFGKGSVQTVLPLDATHAVKLTTALYHTPSGRLIQNQGITPDIYVTDNLKASENKDLQMIDPVREFQLKDHLSNEMNKSDPNILTHKDGLALEDFQLYESLNILKALTLKNKAQAAN
jgi:carboxyl-terminal processing protease